MSTKGRVLVVEDDPSIAELLVYALEGEGYDVVPVGDGALALAVITETVPDLVTLDLGLPGISGEELLRALRSDERTRRIPVIIVSANVDRMEKGDRELAAAVIAKPFDMSELLEAILGIARASAPARLFREE